MSLIVSVAGFCFVLSGATDLHARYHREAHCISFADLPFEAALPRRVSFSSCVFFFFSLFCWFLVAWLPLCFPRFAACFGLAFVRRLPSCFVYVWQLLLAFPHAEPEIAFEHSMLHLDFLHSPFRKSFIACTRDFLTCMCTSSADGHA